MFDRELDKFENESDLSYIIRMCDNKELLGLSWKELASIMNKTLNQDFDESAYRKKYQYYKMCKDDIDSNEAVKKDILEELENKRIELKKEVYKIQTLRIDDNKRIREQSRNDLYFEEVIRAIENKNNDFKVKFKDFKDLQKDNKDEQYVLCFSDVHFGKTFQSINNLYDCNEVGRRFQTLFDEIIDAVKKYKIKNLIICALGDLIEGMTLRVSQLKSLEIGLVDQTIKFANMIIEWLKELSEYVEIEYYSVMSSNHSQLRPYGSKPNEFVDEDMERVIVSMLETAFKDNERVHINTTEEKYQKFSIFDYNIILLHGHEAKGLDNVLQSLSWQHKYFFDYAIMGHYHRNGVKCVGESYSNNCEIINCPSVMGSDEYSDSLGVGSKAAALLIKFTRNQGKRSVEDIILN